MTIVILVGVFVFVILRTMSGAYNAKMDTVKDKYESSIYNNKEDFQWYSPNDKVIKGVIKDGGWRLKHDVDKWRVFAKRHLPSPIYFIVNRVVKPAWDPFSDYWHYTKCRMFVCTWMAALVLATTTYLSHSYIPIIVGGILWEIVSMLSFNGWYNDKLKTKK